jgi:hypothetical protein
VDEIQDWIAPAGILVIAWGKIYAEIQAGRQ